MSDNPIPIRLYDQLEREPVDALLYAGLTEDQIRAAQGDWEPIRKDAIERLHDQGVSLEALPKHWGWDWTRKISRLGSKVLGFYGIECAGQMQGMMEVAKEGSLRRTRPRCAGAHVRRSAHEAPHRASMVSWVFL